ncbi:ral guanine nucleotide dissociation stimulator-like protein 1-like protein [Leptotrombidium deliense]|uniref:Ral guanine nucleotide dissociation stimulator-like protein 1-like protein n=1 Tax=Leptotrombidium deliense TaxID=299467 RepID=A0A443SEG4_9ACAR|nr:ral guanine nucleotide dissociation stimulator-like protein 1-like protein [Leptotrombidium deliense]
MILSRSSPNSTVSSENGPKYVPNRRFWCEEVNEDSIYAVYLKKITYSCNTDLKASSVENVRSPKNGFHENDNRRRSMGKGKRDHSIDSGITRCDESANRRVKVKDNDGQCLQWETRQIRILKAATLEHIMEYILLLTGSKSDDSVVNHCPNGLLEEERNNVSHVMHVLFSTYRSYCSPHELFIILMNCSRRCCPKQFQFVLHYWLSNYPDDYTTTMKEASSEKVMLALQSMSITLTKPSSEVKEYKRLIDILLALPKIDDAVYRKALCIFQDLKASKVENVANNYLFAKGSSSCILELDSKFVAQQLTAIDLENFLSLQPYSMISGPRSNQKVKNSIKNFNLLSKHVIVTILKSYSPDSVASHWIDIAAQLRKMKNFNSLKAVIAGLTNESIYRLKNVVWSKISRGAMEMFVNLSTIVDDVNNQTTLRQTQLEIEGTAKASFHEDSFGTIPYLGTFLTDLTVIDTKQPNYIQSAKAEDKKLVNLEKCSKQFEIITQLQLLQKNLRAALTAFHQSQQINGFSKLPPHYCAPTVPRVARLFRNWFQDSNVSAITENDCYELSLSLEPKSKSK